ncbi:hypothetical protein BpHYR1_048206 [Brachionus plicatilis]|uniref:Uncharacterized protein n=1 Tax=Brachionus plicatilis TaxID=10195 RepID=A0A3M7QJC9_BRAPC|nr:hypothetical protein BpHYR1_048206 [Brachionus plicatilis]
MLKITKTIGSLKKSFNLGLNKKKFIEPLAQNIINSYLILVKTNNFLLLYVSWDFGKAQLIIPIFTHCFRLVIKYVEFIFKNFKNVFSHHANKILSKTIKLDLV